MDTGAAGPLHIDVLGPVRVVSDGHELALGPPQQRAVLAVLATRANHPVAVGELVDAIWGSDPPASAENGVHLYIAGLRRVLEPDRARRGPGQVLVSTGSGYLLRLEPGQLDAKVFDDCCQWAYRHRAAHDLAGAAQRLQTALELWRGKPFTGIPGPFAQVERTRLDELRLTAVEQHADVLLELGRHTELVAELSRMAREHPLREPLWGLLMLALYRCGRQAEALAAFGEARRALIEELGIDPGVDLQRLRQRILTSDPELILACTTTTPAHPTQSVLPRQLPAPPRLFTGRSRELSALDEALITRTDRDGKVVISAIGGTGGIGKTWLALHWAHRNLTRFPDGQLYVNLRGFDPAGEPLSPRVAVHSILDALGVQSQAIPADLDALVALYRSLVAGKHMLILLDNARDTSQILPLLPGTPTCTVLVTSRRHLAGLVAAHGAQPLSLDVLTDADARELLTRHLGTRRVTAEPDAVTELLDGCAGLPLALSIIAARAKTHPVLPLNALTHELRDTATRLEALNVGELTGNLRAAFSASYHALPPETAQVFRLLGLAPGPDISLPAAASLTGLTASQTHALLRELDDVHLVQYHLPGRYRMHDLTHLYAAEQATQIDPEQTQYGALRRLVDFYLHTAYAGARLLDPHRRPIELEAPSGECIPQPLADDAAALAWFSTENQCLLAIHQLAVRRGWDTSVWRLAWSLTSFHYRQGRLHDDVTAWQAGLAAAQRQRDPAALALAHRFLGRARAWVGEQIEAVDNLQRALRITERIGDIYGQADTHRGLAWVFGRQCDDQRALTHATSALRLFQTLDDPVWSADALNQVGWYHAELGHHQQAHASCEQALTLYRRHHDGAGQADTLDSLGHIAHRAGQPITALRYYRQALILYRSLGNTYGEADTTYRVGSAHHAAGQFTDARRAWLHALNLYQTQHRTTQARHVSDQLTTLP